MTSKLGRFKKKAAPLPSRGGMWLAAQFQLDERSVSDIGDSGHL